METETSKFDKVILSVVILIGAIFIGISILSITKNSGGLQQAASVNLTTLETKKENVPINGICGLSSGKVFESSPASDLCSTGNSSVVVLDKNDIGQFYVWQCIGINGGITASCNATANINDVSGKINGECGNSDGQEISKMPDAQEEYCRTGNYAKGDCAIPIYDSKDKKWKSNCSWTCVGDNGGGDKKCTAILVK
ncbi:MAG: hypothetical protein WCX74_02835 [Candidatus Paceibacterota bacterium]